MVTQSNVAQAVDEFLRLKVPEVCAFWQGESIAVPVDSKVLLAHADYVYTQVLLGNEKALSLVAAKRFAGLVAAAPLAGKGGVEKAYLPHLTAYCLGTLNLLASVGLDYRKDVLKAIELDINRLVDGKTMLPRWPRKWSHHVWRVSHWIGGIPSILLTFAWHDGKQQVTEKEVREVLEACDQRILVKETGLMRPYRSKLLQWAFRKAYTLRHNPGLADIGGLVHLHWVNHAMGRPYVAVDKLIFRCVADIEKHKPFLESTPYCLDFDYIQLLRTALEQRPEMRKVVSNARIAAYADSIVDYLGMLPAEGYTVHRLPGALASLHEAAMILGEKKVRGLDCKPLDIIKTAYWL